MMMIILVIIVDDSECCHVQEDLVEVKPKMVMTVFACLMARSYGKSK